MGYTDPSQYMGPQSKMYRDTRNLELLSVLLALLLSNDPGKNCSFKSIVLHQYSFPTLKCLCFQTENLSTDGKQVYEIKCI